MTRTAGILLTILVLASLAVSACGDRPYDPGVDVEEVVASSLAAQSGVVTYRFDMFQMVYTYGQQGILVQEYTVSDNAVGVVDAANKTMTADMSVTVSQTATDPRTTQLRLFMIGDSLYTGTLSPGQQWTWQKQALPPGTWDNQQALSQQLRLLEDGRPRIVREEVVGGVDCWVVELKPDIDRFWDTVSGSLAGEMSSVSSPEDLITGFGLTQWIARDTGLMARTQAQANLHLDPEDMDMVVLVEIQFSHQNEPVAISLPPEAESLL